MSQKKKRKHVTPPAQQPKTPLPAPVAPANANRRTIIGAVILIALLGLGSAGVIARLSQNTAVSASQPAEPPATVAAPSAPSAQTAPTDAKIIVYYFYGNYRCDSCTLIEQYTEEAVLEAFTPEIERGLVEFRGVNVEKPETRHFIQDYQLYTKSVIVSEVVDGKEQRWKNLAKIWELVMNEKAFKDYIKAEVATYRTGENS